MQIPILGNKDVERTIRKAGQGRYFGDKVTDIAKRTCSSERTLHTYTKEGAKKGPLNLLLWQLAVRHGILSSDENPVEI